LQRELLIPETEVELMEQVSVFELMVLLRRELLYAVVVTTIPSDVRK
jgi:hypothetical protein